LKSATFALSLGKTLKLSGYFSHTGHKDVSRILKLDNRLLTISQFGVMQHDDLHPETLVGEYPLPVSPENPCFHTSIDYGCGQ